MELRLSKIDAIRQIPDREDMILAAAQMYADLGIRIVPIRPNHKALPGSGVNYQSCSRKLATISKWFGIGGRYRGWNIGIACGQTDGVAAIDIDNIEEWEKVIPEDFEFKGPIQNTPSGGQHLLVKWTPEMRSSTSKIAPGVDTRGGDHSQCRSHIVVWPSIVNDIEYTWVQDGVIPIPDDFVLKGMGKGWDPLSEPVHPSLKGMKEEDLEKKLDLSVIAEMLDVIPIDEIAYDQWLKCGQAIHTQYNGQDGYDVWHEWSKKGERYDKRECQIRWNGFKEEGEVRVASIVYFAKKYGWSGKLLSPEEKKSLDIVVEEMNEEFAVVPIGSKVMFIQEIPESHRTDQSESYRLLTREALNSVCFNRRAATVDEFARPVITSHDKIWLAHEDRREYVGMGMFPNKPPVFQGWYNLWRGFAYESNSGGSWKSFKDHIHNIICSRDEELTTFVLDWMADLIQDPENPKGVAIILIGIEGCGKGTFAQMFGKLFGVHYKHVTDPEHLVGKFNGHLADSILLFADEVTYGGDKKVAGKLKALVSEKHLMLERKGVDAVQYRNCTRLMVASNEKWVIPAGAQARRWLVLDVDGQKANHRPYFDHIHKEMENGGYEAMLHELKRRKITSNLRMAPSTEALRIQKESYSRTDPTNAFMIECLNMQQVPGLITDTEGVWPEDALIKTEVYQAYKDYCKSENRKAQGPAQFWRSIKPICRFTDHFTKVGNRRVRCMKFLPHEEACVAAEKAIGYVKETEHED